MRVRVIDTLFSLDGSGHAFQGRGFSIAALSFWTRKA
jgi:hypothetical protein